jgi:UDP-glucuronate 4-epimerase
MTATIIVTGAAGFIGYHLCERLLTAGPARVIGVDCLVPYYDVRLKEARRDRLLAHPGYTHLDWNLADREQAATLFSTYPAAQVVHFAAQPGVRYSIENPAAYVDNNLVAFANVLEGVRGVAARSTAAGITSATHLVYASSSSVYGNSQDLPFSETQSVDSPISFYAATKKANELMAHTYAHLYGFAATGLRFFTVYGPWGRPDMAIFKFTRMILNGEPIPVFNQGQLIRDYTYIDDIVEGIVRVLQSPPPRDANGTAHAVFNIGNNQPVWLLDFIRAIESAAGRSAQLDFQPMQPGDVLATQANVDKLATVTGFAPATPVAEGVARFVRWYREYYGLATPGRSSP